MNKNIPAVIVNAGKKMPSKISKNPLEIVQTF